MGAITTYSLHILWSHRALGTCLALIWAMGVMTNGAWIDVDTPKDKLTTKSYVDGSTYHLVMSDEFNVPGRSFADGDDPMWTALDKPDDDFSAGGRGSQHFYNSSRVTTTDDGYLQINTKYEKTTWDYLNVTSKEYIPMTRTIASGMVQGWNKFCFTGGIVEVDVTFPGLPHVGGLWPAVWILGNLGRATYEASTNNLWPWSYDTCKKGMQKPQKISACNNINHYGLEPHVGRGATEIDIVEVMYGKAGKLSNTIPPIEQPYADFTLQVAPGVQNNRPPFGMQPIRDTKDRHGIAKVIENTWYEGLGMMGNTSLNPYFYGTYLAETLPGEPVTRTKSQAFQADAVCAMNQLVNDHFKETHTYRLEWQPGDGGRLDWYVQGYKMKNETTGEVFYMTGDGKGKDWYPAYTITDEKLKLVEGAQIPIEPSYLIFNTAVSTTWGFPYDTPDQCSPCFDCADPVCRCNFNDGFCEMIGTPGSKGNRGKDNDGVNLLIDSVRVYQSKDHASHVGAPHTLGCDPPEYPTRQFIKANEYKYNRAAPWVYDDPGPLREVIQKGGALCETDVDCGGSDNTTATNNTTSQVPQEQKSRLTTSTLERGFCGSGVFFVKHKRKGYSRNVCVCNVGFTGPNCLAIDHKDDSPSAMVISGGISMFRQIESFHIPYLILILLGGMILIVVGNICFQVRKKHTEIARYHRELVAMEHQDTGIGHENDAGPLNVTENSALLGPDAAAGTAPGSHMNSTSASGRSIFN